MTDSGTTPPPDTTRPPGTTQPPATGDAALKKAIADAQKAYSEGEAALKEQDWAAYGKAQADLQDALQRAAAAQPKSGSANSANGSDKADGADKAGADKADGADSADKRDKPASADSGG